MFKKANWQTEIIVQGISRIPIWQAHFIIWMAMGGASMFTIGLLRIGSIPKASLDAIPNSVLLMSLGFACFSLFFPMPYIVYLAKELQKTKTRIEELEGKRN